MAYKPKVLTVSEGGTGNTTKAAYSLVAGGTSTTGAFQAVNPVATGQVLISGGVSALPSFSAYPQVSGLGIGASAGSTAGLTFDGTNFMAAYATGSFTPAINFGGGTTGITYTSQTGTYYKIGKVCYVLISIVLSNKGSSSGALNITGLPFTVNTTMDTSTTWFDSSTSFPTGCTYVFTEFGAATTTATCYATGTLKGANAMQNTNLTNTSVINVTGFYFTT